MVQATKDEISEHPPQTPDVLESTDRLRCSLSINNKVSLGAEQAEKLNELDELKRKLDEYRSNIVRQQKEITGRIARISETIRNGYEFREVPVEITTDYAVGLVTKKRLDTGEVYESRQITSSERQVRLDIGREAPLDALANQGSGSAKPTRRRGKGRGSSAA